MAGSGLLRPPDGFSPCLGGLRPSGGSDVLTCRRLPFFWEGGSSVPVPMSSTELSERLVCPVVLSASMGVLPGQERPPLDAQERLMLRKLIDQTRRREIERQESERATPCCAQCGSPLPAGEWKNRYCSNECRVEWRRTYERRWGRGKGETTRPRRSNGNKPAAHPERA